MKNAKKPPLLIWTWISWSTLHLFNGASGFLPPVETYLRQCKFKSSIVKSLLDLMNTRLYYEEILLETIEECWDLEDTHSA